MNLSPTAVGVAQQFIRQEVRTDAERIDLHSIDVAQSVGHGEPRSQARIVPFRLQEGVVLKGRREAIRLEIQFADEARHFSGQSPIRAKELEFDVHLDPSPAQVDSLLKRWDALAGEGGVEPAAHVQFSSLME